MKKEDSVLIIVITAKMIKTFLREGAGPGSGGQGQEVMLEIPIHVVMIMMDDLSRVPTVR